MATLAADTEMKDVTGLSAGAVYDFRIEVYNAAEAAEGATVTVDLSDPLEAPPGLTGSATSQTAAELSWTDNSSNASRGTSRPRPGSGGTSARRPRTRRLQRSPA